MTRPAGDVPPKWDWLFDGFRKYAVRYMRKHFHAVRLSGAAVPTDDAPVLAVMNHPAWWDALLAFVVSREFAGRSHYGAIEAAQLTKYRFFARAGCFGVDANTFRGAAAFLRTGQAILARPNACLWVNAQGEFVDVRTRPLTLRSGVGHLAARLTRGWVVPIAFEYPFWTERTPEALVRFGAPLAIADHPGESGKAWTARIEAALTATCDALAADAISRDPGRFRTVVAGKAGIGGVYDVWRRTKALATGKRFEASHGGDRP